MGKIKQRNRSLKHHASDIDLRLNDAVFFERLVKDEVHRALREMRAGRVQHHKIS